jgi:hypothetical protein
MRNKILDDDPKFHDDLKLSSIDNTPDPKLSHTPRFLRTLAQSPHVSLMQNMFLLGTEFPKQTSIL